MICGEVRVDVHTLGGNITDGAVMLHELSFELCGGSEEISVCITMDGANDKPYLLANPKDLRRQGLGEKRCWVLQK